MHSLGGRYGRRNDRQTRTKKERKTRRLREERKMTSCFFFYEGTKEVLELGNATDNAPCLQQFSGDANIYKESLEIGYYLPLIISRHFFSFLFFSSFTKSWRASLTSHAWMYTEKYTTLYYRTGCTRLHSPFLCSTVKHIRVYGTEIMMTTTTMMMRRRMMIWTLQPDQRKVHQDLQRRQI